MVGQAFLPDRVGQEWPTYRRSGRRYAERVWRAGAAVLLAVLVAALPARPHPISLTTSVIDVRKEVICVDVELMLEDLLFYQAMEHDEDFSYPRVVLEAEARAHGEFLLEYLHLRDAAGRRLTGRVREIDFSGLDGVDRVDIDDLMAYTIRYLLEYPLTTRPAYLTVAQLFGGDHPPVPAEMDIDLLHHGIYLESITALSHRSAHTFELDWERDFDAAADDPLALARERQRRRREDPLGIVSYSRVYSYLYIEPRVVRHELLIPLLTLEEWVPLDREATDVITVAEQAAARPAITAFLTGAQSVEVNGQPITPDVERIDFFGPEYRDFARRPEPSDASVFNTRVGVILSFPSPGRARQVEFVWNHYDERLPFLRSRIYVRDDPGQDVMLTRTRRRYTWAGEAPDAPSLPDPPPPAPPPSMALPLVSLALGLMAAAVGAWTMRDGGRRRRAGLAAVLMAALAVVALPVGRIVVPRPIAPRPEPDPTLSRAVIESLLHRLYAAFEHREEDAIYDTLSGGVAGPLLETLYLEIRRGLLMQEQGGAVSRVKALELLDGRHEPTAPAPGAREAFDYRATWTVTGSVEHWGHIHTRRNRFEANFRVDGYPEGWRITAFEPLREERQRILTRARE